MLDDTAIERYARQIVVPGIGAAGQEKLLNSTVLVVGHPRGCATAALYLRAAGVRVSQGTRETPSSPVDVVIVCDVAAARPEDRRQAFEGDVSVCWYALAGDGFAAGVYPLSEPPKSTAEGCPSKCEALHDAAACHVASAACALLVDLPGFEKASSFEF